MNIAVCYYILNDSKISVRIYYFLLRLWSSCIANFIVFSDCWTFNFHVHFFQFRRSDESFTRSGSHQRKCVFILAGIKARYDSDQSRYRGEAFYWMGQCRNIHTWVNSIYLFRVDRPNIFPEGSIEKGVSEL